MSKCLNLGCGDDVRVSEEWINHDLTTHRPEIDVAWDLNVRPWPWEDCSFDEIEAVSVFEHLELTLIETLDECWRILKPAGQLHVKYPVFTSPFVHDDPTHRWYWSSSVFDFVDPDTKYGKTYRYYTRCHWRIIRKTCDEKQRNCWVTLTPRGKE